MIKQLILFSLLGTLAGYSQCTNQINHEVGTETINNVSVSIFSSGLVDYGSNCSNAIPYTIGRDEMELGDGSYTFNFSPSINSLTLNFNAIDNVDSYNNEEVELFINGSHYMVNDVGIVDYHCGSETYTTLPIITSQGYIGDPPGDNKGSRCKDLTINGVIESLEVKSHVVGSAFGLSFSLFICDGILTIPEYSMNEFFIYPNPFDVKTTLTMTQSLNNGVVYVYNLNGQKVKEIENIQGNTIEISRDGLLKGVYILQVKENEKTLITTSLLIK